MLRDSQVLEDYIVTMSNTVILGKQWRAQDTPEDLLRPTGLLMYTDRKEVITSDHQWLFIYSCNIKIVPEVQDRHHHHHHQHPRVLNKTSGPLCVTYYTTAIMSMLLWPIVCVAVWSAEQFRLQCTLECPQWWQRRDRRRLRIPNFAAATGRRDRRDIADNADKNRKTSKQNTGHM